MKALDLIVKITETNTAITIENDLGQIFISKEVDWQQKIQKNQLYLLLNAGKFVMIGTLPESFQENQEIDQTIVLSVPKTVHTDYLANLLIEETKMKKNQQAISADRLHSLSVQEKKETTKYKEQISLILASFGFPLQRRTAKKGMKVRHTWRKSISEMAFYVDSRESKATVIWQKRNEMLLKAGAKLKKEIPLNKDGSIGFSVKMGEKLRADHADAIVGFYTTKDIILKSVNEIGLLLYFGGTNSWLELKDSEGKTIDDWTRVD
ncbi:hypothetical protein ACYSNW_12130 [Enterococcus sp. LJL99]